MNWKIINDNTYKENFKTLDFHTKFITFLGFLKDRRLASCSYDGLFNIYNKESFNLEVSIKHISIVSLFIQLNDERIATLSDDIIISLLHKNNKFEIEQVLEEQTDDCFDPNIIYKIIEVKENELLSI